MIFIHLPPLRFVSHELVTKYTHCQQRLLAYFTYSMPLPRILQIPSGVIIDDEFQIKTGIIDIQPIWINRNSEVLLVFGERSHEKAYRVRQFTHTS